MDHHDEHDDASSPPGSEESTSTMKEMLRISSTIDTLMIAADQDHHQVIHKVLSPDRDHVHKALLLHRCKSNSLSNLLSSYFQYSEETSSLCLTLRRSVIAASRLYCPINCLVHELPVHSSSLLSQSHCNLVFQELVKFTQEPNPFPHPDSKTFDSIRDLFCDLKRKLDRRLRKSSSRIRLVPPPDTVCCGATAFTAYIPPKFVRREVAYAAQLTVASRKTYYLKTGLDTLHRLVVRLHNAVEHDKNFIQVGLNMGNNNHTVQKVLQELQQNHQCLAPALVLLEDERDKYFTIVNNSRKELLQEILRHQTSSESSHSPSQ